MDIFGLIIIALIVIGYIVDYRYKFMPIAWCHKMYVADPGNYKPVYKNGKYFGLKHNHRIYLSVADLETRERYFPYINEN